MQPAILCWDIEDFPLDSTMDVDLAVDILMNKMTSEGMELTMLFAPGCVSQAGMLTKFRQIENINITCHAIPQKAKDNGGDEAYYQIIMEMGKFRRNHPHGAIILISKDSDFTYMAKSVVDSNMKFVLVRIGNNAVSKLLLKTAPEVWDWKEMYDDAVASMVS